MHNPKYSGAGLPLLTESQKYVFSLRRDKLEAARMGRIPAWALTECSICGTHATRPLRLGLGLRCSHHGTSQATTLYECQQVLKGEVLSCLTRAVEQQLRHPVETRAPELWESRRRKGTS